MRRQRLRPIETQCFAQMAEGAGHRDLVVAAPFGEVDDPDRAVGLEQPHDRCGQRLGRARVEQLLRQHVPLMLDRRAEQTVDAGVETVDTGFEPRHDGSGLRERLRNAQQVGHLRRHRRRGLTEQRQADALVDLRFVERVPDRGQVEQALDRDEGRRDVAERTALLFDQFERMDDAHAVDDAVRDLRCDDFAAKLMVGDRLPEIALHLVREGRGKVAAERRIVRQVAMLDCILQRELGGREQHREFGARQSAPFGGTAEKLVVRSESFDLAIEPARCLERLHDPHERRHCRRSALFGDRQRKRL